jgi:hypothetical protein
MSNYCLRLLIAAGFLFALPQISWGWGKEGHEVVGKVAEKFLSAPAKRAIDDLLKDDQFKSIGDTRLTSWADFIRNSAMFKKKYPNNDKFHYLDIDVESDLAMVDVAKIASEGENALVAVRRFQKVLKDPTAELQAKREALFFIVHIIGDLHQPLHCAERTGDKGGNLCQVFLPGETMKINLHKVWDTSFVLKDIGAFTVPDFTTKLLEEITPESKAADQKGTLEDWILDSQKIARESIYKVVPKTAQTGETFQLKEDDVKAGTAVVHRQLAKGGLRLAAFLNDTFKE